VQLIVLVIEFVFIFCNTVMKKSAKDEVSFQVQNILLLPHSMHTVPSKLASLFYTDSWPGIASDWTELRNFFHRLLSWTLNIMRKGSGIGVGGGQVNKEGRQISCRRYGNDYTNSGGGGEFPQQPKNQFFLSHICDHTTQHYNALTNLKVR
jgi:hypothetical protein